MIGRLGEYFRSTKAVSALEYAMIVTIVIVGLSTAVVSFRNSITDYLTNATTKVGALPT